MLSTPEFPGFASKIIPFMHVTTRIKERKYEGLLSEKGFGGFPSLAFMDAKGEVVAKPQGRSVQVFEETLVALEARANLLKRIEAGEKGLDVELLFAEHALGAVQPDDFAERAKACEELTEAQQGRIDQILLDNEVLTLAGGARRGGPGLESAATAFLKMLDNGKHPSKELRIIGSFWGVLVRWAGSQSDATLARRVATGLRADLAENTRYVKMAEGLEKTAGGLDKLAALNKRVEEGAEGLEADVLVVEFDLGKQKGPAFAEKAEALLEKATAEQKTALESRLLQVKFQGYLQRTRDPTAQEANAKALLELLGEDGQPPEQVAGAVWQTLLIHARLSADPDLMARALDGMKKAYAGEAALVGYVKNMEKQIQALREKKAAEAKDDEPSEDTDG